MIAFRAVKKGIDLVGFFRTLQRIWHCDGIYPIYGIGKHILWQRRKFQNNFKIILNISDSKIIACNPIGVAPLVNAMNIYDYNNMNLIKGITSTINGIFIDVGANIGSYTLIASEQKKWKVISIEPHPQTFKELVENISLNSRSNIIPLNIALTNKNSKAILSINDIDSTKNRIVKNGDKINNTVNVSCRKLDSICSELKIEPLLVKIDVEGNEKEVLDGFKEYLNLVQLLIIENGEKKAVKDVMKIFGFLGPFYVHYYKKRIIRTPHKAKEDPIFFRDNIRTEFEKIGLRL